MEINKNAFKAREIFETLDNDQKWSVVRILTDEKEALISQVKEMARRQMELAEARKLANIEKYSPSSEQMRLLFPEMEVIATLESDDCEEVTVREHKRVIHKHRTAVTLPKETPIYEVRDDKGAPDEIVKDGVRYKRVGNKTIDQVAIIPTRHVIERHVKAQYEPETGEGGRIAPMENPKVEGIYASPSLVADIIHSKMGLGLPLYRQEGILRSCGLAATRQTMARWVILYYEQLLPLEKRFKEAIYSSNLVLKDETRVQVLDLRSKSGRPSANSFMHVTIGCTVDRETRKERCLALFEYKPGRSVDYLLEDLRRYGFKGHLMTDGLRGYRRHDESRHAVCWVHAVRHFKNALKVDRSCALAKNMAERAAELFEIDSGLRERYRAGEIDDRQFLETRRERSLPVIDGILKTAEENAPKFVPNGEVSKGIAYLMDHKDNLGVYLDVLEADPSNNRCERAIRPFSIGRKNWLFCQSVDGADASAFFYSLVETAKMSGLLPADYLELVCQFGPYAKTDADWDALLPWNADMGRLDGVRALRNGARPDPARTEPYILSGNTR